MTSLYSYCLCDIAYIFLLYIRVYLLFLLGGINHVQTAVLFVFFNIYYDRLIYPHGKFNVITFVSIIQDIILTPETCKVSSYLIFIFRYPHFWFAKCSFRRSLSSTYNYLTGSPFSRIPAVVYVSILLST